MRSAAGLSLSAGLITVLGGCASAVLPAAHAPGEVGHTSTTADDENQPLVVEWNAQDRATIPAHIRTKTLVVRYDGTTISPLWQCRADGSYRYAPTPITPQRAAVADSDQLRASVPALKVALGASVKRDSKVAVSLTVVGRYENTINRLHREDLHDDQCAKATHYVAALTVGAYHFESSASAEVSGSATIVGKVGVDGSSDTSKQVVHGGGDEEACKVATLKDAQAPNSCDAVLRLELQPLVEGGGGGLNTQEKAAIGVGVVGVLAVGAGAYFGLSARSAWSDANTGCDSTGCDPASISKGSDARTSANLSTIFFAAGGVALAGATVLWLTAPSKKIQAPTVGLAPAIDPRGGAGLNVTGGF